MYKAAVCLVFGILATNAVAQENYVPPHGFVPDKETAVAIARAVLIPIYGAKTIQAEEPLSARRDGGSWIVQGTVPCPKEGKCVGGAAYIKLSAEDAQILFVTHYR